MQKVLDCVSVCRITDNASTKAGEKLLAAISNKFQPAEFLKNPIQCQLHHYSIFVLEG